MINDKDDCLCSITSVLRRCADWRDTLTARFDDPRNANAARACRRIADEAALTDDDWAALQPHYNWVSQKWLDALQQATRLIGFRPITDFPSFLRIVRRTLAA